MNKYIMIKETFLKLVSNKASILFISNILGLPLGFISSILLTKFLGSSGYGDFQFFINFFNLVVVIVNIGLFHAGSRAFTLSENDVSSREYYGSLLILFIFIGILSTLIVLSYSLFDTNIVEKKLNTVLLFLIPVNWMYICINFADVIFQADNKIKELAIFRVLPKFLFVICIAIILYFYRDEILKKLLICLYIYFVLHGLCFFLILKKISPIFSNYKLRIREILRFNKSFGLDVYLGSVASVGFGYLSGILISYFDINNAGVGYFSLAMTISSPLLLIPNTMATSHYKEFATMNVVPKKMFTLTFIVCLMAMIFLWFFVPVFIDFFYGKEFRIVGKLSFILSMGFLLHGLGDFFNRFLGAHGQGKILRNSSLLVGTSTLLLNFILIPLFKVEGSAYAKISASTIYFVSMFFYYKKYTKSYNRLDGK